MRLYIERKFSTHFASNREFRIDPEQTFAAVGNRLAFVQKLSRLN